MRKIQQLLFIALAIFTFSSCEILRDVAQDQVDKHATCIPAAGATYTSSYKIIAGKTFERDRLNSANRETKRLRCMTSTQIKGFVDLLTFENKKLEYVKYAYGFCSDPDNFYPQMESSFTFRRSKEELEMLTR